MNIQIAWSYTQNNSFFYLQIADASCEPDMSLFASRYQMILNCKLVVAFSNIKF